MKTPLRTLTALALTLSITACATPYGSKGLFGGFEETRLDANTMRVHFQGNGFTSKQKVETYTLLRCAELTKENGYDWFLIVDQGTEAKDTQVHSGTYSSYSTTGGGSTWATTTPDARGTSLQTTGGGSTWSNTSGWTSPSVTSSIRKYDSSVVIKMFSGERPQEAMNGYIAEDVLTYLGSQVERKG